MFWNGRFPTFRALLTFGPSQILGGEPGPSGMLPDPRRRLPKPWPDLVFPFNAWAFGGIGRWVRPDPRPFAQTSRNNSWGPLPGSVLSWPPGKGFAQKPPPTPFSGF